MKKFLKNAGRVLLKSSDRRPETMPVVQTVDEDDVFADPEVHDGPRPALRLTDCDPITAFECAQLARITRTLQPAILKVVDDMQEL